MVEFELKELSPWADIANVITRMNTLTVAIEKGRAFGKSVVKTYTGRARLSLLLLDKALRVLGALLIS